MSCWPMLAPMKTARMAFSLRLLELCAEHGLKERGRQADLAKLCKVTQPAVKKWLDGDSLPGLEHCMTLATWANVCFEWLMTGRGPKRAGDAYQTAAIAHVVATMQTMEESQQYLVSRITDEIAASKETGAGKDPNKPEQPNSAISASL